MKKMLACAALALLVVAATERPAQAWVNSKFSVGLSWHFQSANNSVLWGLFRNGQNPPFAPGYNPYYNPYANYGYGYGLGGYGLTATTPVTAAPAYSAPTVTPSPAAAAPSTGAQTWNYNGYYASPFQTVGYSPDAYSSGYTTGYYAAPSYWYGQ